MVAMRAALMVAGLLAALPASGQGVQRGPWPGLNTCPARSFERGPRYRFGSTTNLLIRSQEMTDVSWPSLGMTTATANAAIAPDGTTTAERFASTNASHNLRKDSIAISANTAYVFSFYAKNNGGTRASYSVYCVTGAPGNIIAPTAYVAQMNASTWTRIVVPFVTPAACTAINVYLLRDSLAGVDAFLWGAQLEAGLKASPYIATAAIAVTRPPGCYDFLFP